MILNPTAPFGTDAEKVQRRNVYQLIADRLLTEIVENRLCSGTEIPTERELSERYGVGRSSVREGLRMLESQRIIEPGSDGVAIVALTGDMSPDTLMKAEAAGFKAFLRKPADMDRLEMVLRPLLQQG